MLFDFFFVLYIAIQVFLGFRFGVFRRLVSFAAFYLGMLLSRSLSGPTSQQLGYSSGAHPADAHFLIFLVIILFLVVMVEIILAAFGSALSAFNALVFDRFFGTIAGGAAAIIELAVLLYLFNFLINTPVPAGSGHADLVNNSEGQISNSLVAKPLKGLQPAATFIFGPVLPTEPAKYFASTYS